MIYRCLSIQDLSEYKPGDVIVCSPGRYVNIMGPLLTWNCLWLSFSWINLHMLWASTLRAPYQIYGDTQGCYLKRFCPYRKIKMDLQLIRGFIKRIKDNIMIPFLIYCIEGIYTLTQTPKTLREEDFMLSNRSPLKHLLFRFIPDGLVSPSVGCCEGQNIGVQVITAKKECLWWRCNT